MGIEATGSIPSWMPLMIFAFLFGLSMDYEVFILSRMREEYDRTGSTETAVIAGIGRTGRLVTSAALILFLAFIAMASGPGTDLKMFATGLAAGILLDATVIRALIVPAVIALMGRWNWWLPTWPARLLGSSRRCRGAWRRSGASSPAPRSRPGRPDRVGRAPGSIEPRNNDDDAPRRRPPYLGHAWPPRVGARQVVMPVAARPERFDVAALRRLGKFRPDARRAGRPRRVTVAGRPGNMPGVRSGSPDRRDSERWRRPLRM